MKKTLAASFLVTAGIAGCTVHQGPPPNPPQPPPQTVEPTPAPPEPTDPVDVETPEPTDGGGDTTGDLPQPGPNDKIVTKKDGTCWVMPEVDCPPSPATCNPPPPMQVACPEQE